jgi:hypothetical protein
MTALESVDGPILLGELGGRFRDGASQPGHAWAADIVQAIQRKETKGIFQMPDANRHLVIYPNSNASFLLFDDEDEREAFELLLNAISIQRNSLTQLTNGCLVHVLGKEHIFLDILGDYRSHRRTVR